MAERDERGEATVLHGVTVPEESQIRVWPAPIEPATNGAGADVEAAISEVSHAAIPANGAASAAAEAAPLPCERLGEYRLIRLLGTGGMGNVFLANQVSLDRQVAVKTLRPELAARGDLITRFYREAKAMARLDHPHLVTCYAVGQDEASGLHYVAMEFVDGASLHRIANTLGRLELRDVVTVGIAVAEALGHAHARGMIHRDIKPDNILVTQDGIVKVSDLGLAKALDEEVGATSTGMGMGTPMYMAPEQARDAKHVDHRADMHALGCTMYRLLTGVHPFAVGDVVAIIQAKERGQYRPIRRLNPNLPERLEWIVDKLMAPRPESRYADWSEVRNDLKSLNLGGPRFLYLVPQSIVRPATKDLRSPNANAEAESPSSSAVVCGVEQDSSNSSVAGLEILSPPGRSPAAIEIPMWQVCYKDRNGQVSLAKMTAEEIRIAVVGGLFDISAEVKPPQGTGFRKLGLVEQFQDLSTQVSTIQTAKQQLDQYTERDQQRVDREKQGPFYEQRWFLVACGIAVLAVVVWKLFPLSDAQLLSRAEDAFQLDDMAGRLRARELYLEPLIQRSPNSEFAAVARDLVEELDADIAIRRIESKLRGNRQATTEAERLAMKAYQLEQLGDVGSATEIYRAITQMFQADADAQPVVAMARRRIFSVHDGFVVTRAREALLRRVLANADQQHAAGRIVEARAAWTSLVTLYGSMPEAAPFVAYAEARLENREPAPLPEPIDANPPAAPTPSAEPISPPPEPTTPETTPTSEQALDAPPKTEP